MGAGKLGGDAFDVYLGLGSARSYDAVAQHFGVSKRTVSTRAKAEDWRGRLAGIEREARTRADAQAVDVLEARQLKELVRLGEIHDAIHEVVTPMRMKALFASLMKAAVNGENVQAARLVIERVLGRARNEALSGVSLGLPDGLETASDVRTAANALLQAVAEGSIAPEDAQKAATVLESARRSVETEDLEQRIKELESKLDRENRR